MSLTPRIGHAFDFDRDLVWSIGTRLEQVKINHIDEHGAPDVVAAKGYTSIVALNTSLTHNKVLEDRWEGPYSGHREMVSYEYGGQPSADRWTSTGRRLPSTSTSRSTSTRRASSIT